jgi:uncharacterized membrane protein YhaH (DUF805 family)
MESMLTSMWTETSILGLLGIVVALATTAYAAVYAWRPEESRLVLMRPLSLATIFAALCSFNVGIANVLNGISATETWSGYTWQMVAKGTSETFVTLFAAFGCLALTWLCVALGMRRAHAASYEWPVWSTQQPERPAEGSKAPE